MTTPQRERVDTGDRQFMPLEILLVEDNPADIRLTEIALREGRLINKLHTVTDGDDAIAFLEKDGVYKGVPMPDLILLDLNLPKMDGQEVLEIVKTNPAWKHIPIVILTTSNSEDDILASYKKYANSYLVKPISVEKFIQVVSQFSDYWFSIVKLPHQKG